MYHTNKDTKSKCWFGWISPDGQTFPCDYHGHFDLAKKLAGTLGVQADRPMRNPELLGTARLGQGHKESIWPCRKITQRDPGITHVYHTDTGKNPCGPRI